MSKTGASLVLIIIISLMCHLSTARAQDPLNLDILYPSLPNSPTRELVVQWNGKEADPFWEKFAPDSMNMGPGQVPGKKPFFLGSLTDGILDGMRHRELQVSDEQKEALLRGEPQDTSCVMGFRYSFSEFDFGHFCKSLFTLIGNGNSHTAREEAGFAFYVDSPSR